MSITKLDENNFNKRYATDTFGSTQLSEFSMGHDVEHEMHSPSAGSGSGVDYFVINGARVDGDRVGTDGYNRSYFTFNPDTNESIDMSHILPNIDASGLNMSIAWNSEGTGDVVWGVTAYSLSEGSDGSSATAQSTATATAASGLNYTAINIPQSEISSFTAGDIFAIRLERMADDAADTLNDYANLYGLILE